MLGSVFLNDNIATISHQEIRSWKRWYWDVEPPSM